MRLHVSLGLASVVAQVARKWLFVNVLVPDVRIALPASVKSVSPDVIIAG